YHISSFALGLLTPDVINANYDLFWLPSSGASNDSKAFVRAITIPFLFAEHVDGAAEFAGVWAGTGGQFSGNENQQGCPDATTKSITHVRVVPEDMGGNPDHPIVRGLGDDLGNVFVHDVNEVPLNSLYPVPGNGPAG